MVFGLLTKTVGLTALAGGSYYVYRSWNDQNRQKCEDLERRTYDRLPQEVKDQGTRLVDLVNKVRKGGNN